MKPINMLLILFSLLTILIADVGQGAVRPTDALPPLVKGGEPFTNRDDFYIPNYFSSINTIDISEDGKTIAGVSIGTIKIWSRETGKLEQTLREDNSYVTSVAISRDGKTIISGSHDGTIKIWSRETGKLEQTLKGHKSSVNSVAISTDGKTIISGSTDNTIKIWSRKTGKLEQTLKGHKSSINSVAISTDGKTIISGSDDTIKIWSRETGKLEQTLEGHENLILSVAISTDGKTIISGSWDNTIKIWSRDTGKLEQTLKGHEIFVNSVAISTDGKTIISGSHDGTIKIWSRDTGKLEQTLKGHKSLVNSVAISTDGKTIISGSDDKTIKIWSRDTGKLEQILEGHKSLVNSVAISPNGKTIISGSDDKTIKIWSRDTGKLEQTLEGHENLILSVAISPNGKTIISGSHDGTIKIWSRDTGKLEQTLYEHEYSVNSVAISTDGKTIISGSTDNTIKIWSRDTGKLEQTLYEHKYSVNSVAISMDGKTIISGSHDGTIKIWSRETGELEQTLKGHKSSVNSVAISRDGKTIISGSDDSTIKIWSRDTGKLEQTIKGHKDWVRSVAISRDGKTIISGSDDNTIKIWSRDTGKLEQTLKGHKDSVYSVAISTDGKTIISGSLDETVCLWDIKTGKKLKEFIGGQDENWVTFDYKKKRLFRGEDSTLLYKKRGTKLKIIYPKDYNLSKPDKLKLSIKEKNIEIPSGGHIELNLSIENQEDNSYFLTIKGDGKYLSISNKKIGKIEKSKTKTIPLKIYAKLSQKNPKPTQTELNITMLTGNGTAFNLTVPIKISYPNIVIKKAEISEDGENLNVLVQNIGNMRLSKVDVNLSKPFQADITTLTNLEPNATKTLSFALPKDNKKIENNLTISLALPNKKEILANPSGTKIEPSSIWYFENIDIDFKKMAWYLYALMVLGGLFLLWSVWYYRRYKNPIVTKLAQDPKALLTLSPSQLEEAKERLEAINRLQSTLIEAQVTSLELQKTLAFFQSSPEQKATLLAQHIDAKACKKEGDFYRVVMREEFRLDAIKSFLVYITNQNSQQIEHKIITLNDKIFVLTTEEQQNSIAQIAHDKTNRIIAPTLGEMSRLMLSHDPQDSFVKILSHCLLAKDVSPYQTNSGVNSEANFFGRVEILREIVSNDEVNYLIVGARQLGKTTILQALKRRYAKSDRVVSYAFTLDENGELLPAMAEALGLSPEASLEEIVQTIKTHPKKPIFLIDEADKFIKYEKERGYLITSVMRKLSQEGKAMFIMAGFWTLYEYVTLDYQSPLKNFGKLIILEGLEYEACRDLMIEPMKRIGVAYEHEDIVKSVIQLCGRRANYIATLCDVVLRNLKKENLTITHNDIDQALEDRAIDGMLKDWKNISPNPKNNRLDRLIVYLTIKKERFRLADITKGVQKEGLNIDIEQINQSLERLILGYILGKRKGEFYYQIPLLVQNILEDDLEILIEGEVSELSLNKEQ